MIRLIRIFFVCCLGASFVLPPSPAAAQNSDLDMRLPMSIDADSTAYDGKTSTIIFSGLRLSQGRIGIQADEGRAKRMELEDSSWQFFGNVVIDVENGHIECDSAVLEFDDFSLKIAKVTGSPASFKLTRAGTDDETYAEAKLLLYNVQDGIVEFSGEASITEGGNQISSNFLVYNIAEQRINADSAGSEDGRVRITYTPENGDESAAPPDDSADTTGPEDQDENP